MQQVEPQLLRPPVAVGRAAAGGLAERALRCGLFVAHWKHSYVWDRGGKGILCPNLGGHDPKKPMASIAASGALPASLCFPCSRTRLSMSIPMALSFIAAKTTSAVLTTSNNNGHVRRPSSAPTRAGEKLSRAHRCSAGASSGDVCAAPCRKDLLSRSRSRACGRQAPPACLSMRISGTTKPIRWRRSITLSRKRSMTLMCLKAGQDASARPRSRRSA